ncbi:hypothetical protein BCR33DRAFT_211629 [Rhizoclosmatium globosum]|uniref:Uncharacterized protein n=1 Tax=Rhizoclosmatium globosum TaxID=329046 RepID=A0A1Y2CCV7_9FUNG|nr:hypothetical protein BCR33DRAFT_211629 [Rhizoclosmatium globosum]|eukprot:ORY44880.1 hypothetical protein BCR33DRAFT_211629 [Rhizoclosmatium globosum]
MAFFFGGQSTHPPPLHPPPPTNRIIIAAESESESEAEFDFSESRSFASSASFESFESSPVLFEFEEEDVVVGEPFVASFADSEFPTAEFESIDPLQLAFVTSCKIHDEQDNPNFSVFKLVTMQNTLALIYVHWAQAQDGDQDRETNADAEKSLPDVADYDRVAKMEQLESVIANPRRTALSLDRMPYPDSEPVAIPSIPARTVTMTQSSPPSSPSPPKATLIAPNSPPLTPSSPPLMPPSPPLRPSLDDTTISPPYSPPYSPSSPPFGSASSDSSSSPRFSPSSTPFGAKSAFDSYLSMTLDDLADSDIQSPPPPTPSRSIMEMSLTSKESSPSSSPIVSAVSLPISTLPSLSVNTTHVVDEGQLSIEVTEKAISPPLPPPPLSPPYIPQKLSVETNAITSMPTTPTLSSTPLSPPLPPVPSPPPNTPQSSSIASLSPQSIPTSPSISIQPRTHSRRVATIISSLENYEIRTVPVRNESSKLGLPPMQLEDLEQEDTDDDIESIIVKKHFIPSPATTPPPPESQSLFSKLYSVASKSIPFASSPESRRTLSPPSMSPPSPPPPSPQIQQYSSTSPPPLPARSIRSTKSVSSKLSTVTPSQSQSPLQTTQPPPSQPTTARKKRPTKPLPLPPIPSATSPTPNSQLQQRPTSPTPSSRTSLPPSQAPLMEPAGEWTNSVVTAFLERTTHSYPHQTNPSTRPTV